MKRKVLSLALALCLVAALSVPTLAAGASVVNDNDGANDVANGTADTDGTNGTAKPNPATGTGLTFTGSDGIDDATAPDHTATTANTQTIDVNARVYDADAKIRYYIGIVWGDMQFVYSRNGQEWDPVTHKYKAAAGATGTWLVNNTDIKGATDPAQGYLDGINNRIVVVNHSNAAVDATFSYVADGTSFGTAPTGAFNVVGGFYGTQALAVAGAAITVNPLNTTQHNTLGNAADQASTPKALFTGAGRDPATVSVTATATPGNTPVNILTDMINPLPAGVQFATEAFFAFSGTPGTSAPTTFQKVGTITVTIAANTDDIAANTPGPGGF